MNRQPWPYGFNEVGERCDVNMNLKNEREDERVNGGETDSRGPTASTRWAKGVMCDVKSHPVIDEEQQHER